MESLITISEKKMINNKRVLTLIHARGGSKGIPKKNIRLLKDKPLIAWTIIEAKKSKYIDRLILSSDDHEIIQVAKDYNCEVPFIRHKELAQDHTPGIEPVLHVINIISGYDIIILLQPTSPLRTSDDIDQCLEYFIQNNAKICISITEVDKTPYWMFTIDNKTHTLAPLMQQKNIVARRQDQPTLYVPNGAIYIANINYLKHTRSFYTNKTIGFVMPRERSIDIDNEFDFKLAEYLLEK